MNTIELTEILEAVLPKDLLDALNNGETVTIEPPKPKQWEPVGGRWFITGSNNPYDAISTTAEREAGRERATRELAEAAAKASRARDRLEAFRDEMFPDWRADWHNPAQFKYYVYYNGEQFRIASNDQYRSLGTVYGPKEFAEEAARMLNSGELVL